MAFCLEGGKVRFKLSNELDEFNPAIAIEGLEPDDDIFETLLESEMDDLEDESRTDIDEYYDGLGRPLP